MPGEIDECRLLRCVHERKVTVPFAGCVKRDCCVDQGCNIASVRSGIAFGRML
jgi:hypothetical protein